MALALAAPREGKGGTYALCHVSIRGRAACCYRLRLDVDSLCVAADVQRGRRCTRYGCRSRWWGMNPETFAPVR